MATIKINQFRARQFGGASPFGNLTPPYRDWET